LPFYDGSQTVNRSIEYVKESDKDDYNHEVHAKAHFRKNSLYATGGAPAIDAFHFRINKKYVYYTESPAEAVVLGAIAVRNIVKIQKTSLLGPKCFQIINTEFDNWELCTTDEEENCDEWICALDTAMGKECENKEEDGEKKEEGEKTVEKIIQE